jgi:hypothetical protein
MTGTKTKTKLASPECPFCVGGLIPAEPHKILGVLVRRCPTCQPLCEGCINQSTFPTWTFCLGCWQDELADNGVIVALCASCLGGKQYIKPIGGIKPHAHVHTCS